MTFLYSCRHDGDQYRITKLTEHLDVESSYLCTTSACNCPAGEKRGRCRHMEMLPKFINRGAVSTGWLFDFDRGGWVDNRSEEELEAQPPLPAGVQVVSLEDPAELHSAIAEAVGESPEPCGFSQKETQTIYYCNQESMPAPAETKPWRRF